MSRMQLFKECCPSSQKLYIGHFENEPTVVCCLDHVVKDHLLNGAKVVYHLKSKEEGSI